MKMEHAQAVAIKEAARECGFDLVGIAPPEYGDHAIHLKRWLERGFHGEMGYMARNIERRADLQQVLPGIRSVICVALNYYSPTIPLPSTAQGRISKYALNVDYHLVMQRRLQHLLEWLKERHPLARFITFVDTGPVLEKALAERAGLGWIGKHTNLISPHLGSWFFLGEILTDLELAYDEPQPGLCGKCRRCLEACPTQAIVAPYQLDARRCISYLTIELKGEIPPELRPLIGNRIFGCDECQQVCPWNRFARQTVEQSFLPRADLQAPELREMMSLTEERFRMRFRDSPIKRLKRRGLLRNVAVALGNARDRDAIPCLEKARLDEDPLIRSHAAWALAMIEGPPSPVTKPQSVVALSDRLKRCGR